MSSEGRAKKDALLLPLILRCSFYGIEQTERFKGFQKCRGSRRAAIIIWRRFSNNFKWSSRRLSYHCAILYCVVIQVPLGWGCYLHVYLFYEFWKDDARITNEMIWTTGTGTLDPRPSKKYPILKALFLPHFLISKKYLSILNK